MKEDRPIGQYFPSDLQDYVSSMQYWPANAVKRDDIEGLSVLQILETNKSFAPKPVARKP